MTITSFSSSPLATVVRDWSGDAGVGFADFGACLLPQKGLSLRLDRPQVMRRWSRAIWDASETSVSTQPQVESPAASLVRLSCSPAARPLDEGEGLRLRFGAMAENKDHWPLASDVAESRKRKKDAERVHSWQWRP